MPTGLLPFAEPELSDAAVIRSLTLTAQGNDLSFANIYLLREKYGITVAVEDGCLFRHYGGTGRLQGYAFPCGGGNKSESLTRLEEDAALRQRSLRFCLLTEEEKQLLEQWRPGKYAFSANPGNADYLYRRADLAELPGTAYHRKRNHIARFEKHCPDWKYVPLSPENAGDALTVAQGWLEGRAEASLQHEFCAIRHALEYMPELQLCGGVIYVQHQPVAMSVASYISPTVADVHYEKCLPTFREAYPVINRELARRLNCQFINREEDLNQPGLRQAKEAYRPAQLLTKYTAQALIPC